MWCVASRTYPQYRIVNRTCHLRGEPGEPPGHRDAPITPSKADICDAEAVAKVFQEFAIDSAIHSRRPRATWTAASRTLAFVRTNVFGTVTLLNAWHARRAGASRQAFLPREHRRGMDLLHDDGCFTEETPYDPQSPYSASKAASDHFRAGLRGTPMGCSFVLSNCSNNYGSHHFPEKSILLTINNIRQNKPLPVYGQGANVRDWLWVEDHAAAIDVIFHKGERRPTTSAGTTSGRTSTW